MGYLCLLLGSAMAVEMGGSERYRRSQVATTVRARWAESVMEMVDGGRGRLWEVKLDYNNFFSLFFFFSFFFPFPSLTLKMAGFRPEEALRESCLP